MKKIFFALMLFPVTVFSQEKKKPYFVPYQGKYLLHFYTTSGISELNTFNFSTAPFKGDGLGLNVGGGLVVKDYGVAVHYYFIKRSAKNIPKDYNGYTEGFIGSPFVKSPTDFLKEFDICAAKHFYTRNKKIKYTAEIGLAISQINTATNFQPQSTQTGGWFSTDRPNYKFSYDTKKGVPGLVLRGSANFLLTRAGGVEVALKGSFNKYVSYASLDVNMLLGFLR